MQNLKDRFGIDIGQASTQIGGAASILSLVVIAGLQSLPDGQVSYFVWASLAVMALFGLKGVFVSDHRNPPEEQSDEDYSGMDLSELVRRGRQ